MASFDSTNAKRARGWLKHALQYRAARLLPSKRDPRLWIFSAWEGKKYSDNARYLFEYMRSSRRDISCVWQTGSEQLYRELKGRNIPVQLLGTDEARQTQKRAGVAVFTNGIDDFGYEGNVFGAILVCLWHGFGLKQGYRQLYRPKSAARRWLGNLKWDIFSWLKRDITIVVSAYTKAQYAQMFRIKTEDDILIAGQARYDAFSAQRPLEEVFCAPGLAEKLRNKRIVLYMPTFRTDTGAMTQQVRSLAGSSRIKEVLRQHNAVWINKMHYLNRGGAESDDVFIFLNDEDVTDVQQLLLLSDVLVTDYSSCAVDFSLLHRPEIFFFPDWSESVRDRTLIPEIGEICSVNAARSVRELETVLSETLLHPERGLLQCEKIGRYFCDPNVQIGSYAENCCNKIVGRLNEKYGTAYEQLNSEEK